MGQHASASAFEANTRAPETLSSVVAAILAQYPSQFSSTADTAHASMAVGMLADALDVSKLTAAFDSLPPSTLHWQEALRMRAGTTLIILSSLGTKRVEAQLASRKAAADTISAIHVCAGIARCNASLKEYLGHCADLTCERDRQGRYLSAHEMARRAGMAILPPRAGGLPLAYRNPR